jgi:hypothetical protein
MTDYKEKYLKYKVKYLELKGGDITKKQLRINKGEILKKIAEKNAIIQRIITDRTAIEAELKGINDIHDADNTTDMTGYRPQFTTIQTNLNTLNGEYVLAKDITEIETNITKLRGDVSPPTSSKSYAKQYDIDRAVAEITINLEGLKKTIETADDLFNNKTLYNAVDILTAGPTPVLAPPTPVLAPPTPGPVLAPVVSSMQTVPYIELQNLEKTYKYLAREENVEGNRDYTILNNKTPAEKEYILKKLYNPNHRFVNHISNFNKILVIHYYLNHLFFLIEKKMLSNK